MGSRVFHPQPKQVWCTVSGMERRILLIANRQGSNDDQPVTVVYENHNGEVGSLPQKSWLKTHEIVDMERPGPLKEAGALTMSPERKELLTASAMGNGGRQVRVEGRLHASITAAYRVAKLRGFVGSVAHFTSLLGKLPANPSFDLLASHSAAQTRKEVGLKQSETMRLKAEKKRELKRAQRYGPNTKKGRAKIKREADAAELAAAVSRPRVRFTDHQED